MADDFQEFIEKYRLLEDEEDDSTPSGALSNEGIADWAKRNALPFFNEEEETPNVNESDFAKTSPSERPTPTTPNERPSWFSSLFGDKVSDQSLSDLITPRTPNPDAYDYGHLTQLLNAGGYGVGPALGYGAEYLMRGPESAKMKWEDFQAAKDRFEGQNPITSLLEDIGGSLPTSFGVGGLTRQGLQRGLPQLFEKGGKWANRAKRALVGATEGGAIGAAQSNLTDAPIEEDIGLGATLGAPINMLMGGQSAQLTQKTIDSVKKFEELTGVPLQVGQIPGAPSLTREAAHTTPEQKTSLIQAANKLIGRVGDEIDLSDIDAAARVAGSTMGGIGSKYALTPQSIQSLRGELAQIRSEINHLSPDDYKSVDGLIKNVEDQIYQLAGTGEAYQALTQKGSSLASKLSGNDSLERHWAGRIKGALDDAWETSVPPDTLDAWRNARSVYSNAMTLRPAAEATGTGLNWSRVLGETKKKSKQVGQYGHDMRALAEGAQRYLKPFDSQKSGFPWGTLKDVGTIAGGIGLSQADNFANAYLMSNPLSLISQGAGPVGTAIALYGAGKLAGKPLAQKALSSKVAKNILMEGDDPSGVLSDLLYSPALFGSDYYRTGRKAQQ